MILARGKLSAKDREGNIGEEVKVMVDDAREITAEQAQGYQATGRKLKLPGQRKGGRVAAASVGAVKSVGSARSVSAPADPRLYLRLKDSGNQDLLVSLKRAIDQSPGETEVVLVLGPPENKQVIKLPAKVNPTDTLLSTLGQLAGPTNIKLQ